MDDVRPRRERPRWIAPFLWAVPILAWLAFSLAGTNVDAGDPGAEKAGRVVGSAVFALLVALVARLVYVKLVRRGSAVRFWSPWIFVIAAVVAFVAATSRAADNVRQDATDDIDACIRGGVERYDEAAPAERAALREQGITRSMMTEIVRRTCEEAERRGLLDDPDAGTDELQPIVERVVADMRQSGELPPE